MDELNASPYSVVRASTHDQPVTVLQASYPSLVTIKCTHKFTGTSIPYLRKNINSSQLFVLHNLLALESEGTTCQQQRHYLNSSITRCWYDVFLIEVNNIDGSTMTYQNSVQIDISRWDHVPNSDASILKVTNTLVKWFLSIDKIILPRKLWLTFEQVTIMPLLNLKCKTASQWWMSVFTISPVFTSQTRTVESLEPLIITFSSYCRHNTDPVWPVST